MALRYRPSLHWRSMIMVLALFAFLSSLPLSLYEYWQGFTIIPDVRGLGVVLYIAIFPSLIAQSLYMRGVDLIGSNRANLLIWCRCLGQFWLLLFCLKTLSPIIFLHWDWL